MCVKRLCVERLKFYRVSLLSYIIVLPHSIYLIDFDSPQCRDFDSPQCRRNRGVWCHNLWLPVKVGNLFTASVSLKGHEQQQLLAWHDWWLCKHKNQNACLPEAVFGKYNFQYKWFEDGPQDALSLGVIKQFEISGISLSAHEIWKIWIFYSL